MHALEVVLWRAGDDLVLVRVDTPVAFQIVEPREGLVAERVLALVRSLTRMCASMPCEGGRIAERLITAGIFALMRFFSCMRAQMNVQSRALKGLSERSTTVPIASYIPG